MHGTGEKLRVSDSRHQAQWRQPVIHPLADFYYRRWPLTVRAGWEYVGSMKIKTSITLAEDLLKVIDEQSGPHKNRSDFIEKAVRAYVAQVMRDRQNARDLDIINRQADRLNQEAEDVLTYQVLP